MAPGRRGGGGRGRRPRAPSGCAHPGSPHRRRARSPPGRRRGARTPRGARSTSAGDCDRRAAMEDSLAASGEDIVAEAEVLRRGKEIVYAEVDVRNDGGKRIAKGLVTHRALDRPPAGAERQRLTLASPAAAGGEVPKLARAIVSVPFMASLGLAITHMQDGRALVRMPLTPDKTDHDGAIHEGALAALLDTTGAMASWSIAGLDLRYKASTVGIHVSYHAPARADVTAEARTWRRNDEIFLNQVTMSERGSGRVVATGTVTYRIVVP